MYTETAPRDIDILLDFRYRVFAIDHDLFSFTDETFGNLPIVLITNPKNGLFNQPIVEPTGRMLRSTHIRSELPPPPTTAAAAAATQMRSICQASKNNETWFPNLIVARSIVLAALVAVELLLSLAAGWQLQLCSTFLLAFWLFVDEQGPFHRTRLALLS